MNIEKSYSETSPESLYAEHKLAAAALEKAQEEAAHYKEVQAGWNDADEKMDELIRQQQDPEMREWIEEDKSMARVERAGTLQKIPETEDRIVAAENRWKANLLDSMQHLKDNPDQYRSDDNE